MNESSHTISTNKDSGLLDRVKAFEERLTTCMIKENGWLYVERFS